MISLSRFARGLAWGAVALSNLALGPLPQITQIFEKLERSLTGRSLVQGARAMSLERNLQDWIKPAGVSRTDAVLTRVYYPATGREERVREVTVFLRMDLNSEDVLLDLAHELTHATRGAAWDPYDPQLTQDRYIERAIVGVGGEVDALISECRVAQELGLPSSHVSCDRYLRGSVVNRSRLIADFYKTGKDAVLFSSTGRAPYPIALAKEYDALMDVACTNTARRLREARREEKLSSMLESAQAFFAQRCPQRGLARDQDT